MGLYGNRKKKGFRHILGKDDTVPRYHSGFYHRYFEGYTEVRRVTSGGRVAIKRIYTGGYYEQALSLPKIVLLRLLYVLLAAGAGAGFIAGGLGEHSKVLAVVNCALVLGFAVLVLVLGNYLLAPRRMKIYEYRSSSGYLCSVTLALAAALGLFLVGRLGRMVSHGVLPQEGHTLLYLLFAAACSSGIAWIERKVPYRTIKNELDHPIEGVEISL